SEKFWNSKGEPVDSMKESFKKEPHETRAPVSCSCALPAWFLIPNQATRIVGSESTARLSVSWSWHLHHLSRIMENRITDTPSDWETGVIFPEDT
ncbi:MAG: hypothetical protein VCA55_05790, partial [Verrucomicrobiales bacterium]